MAIMKQRNPRAIKPINAYVLPSLSVTLKHMKFNTRIRRKDARHKGAPGTIGSLDLLLTEGGIKRKRHTKAAADGRIAPRRSFCPYTIRPCIGR